MERLVLSSLLPALFMFLQEYVNCELVTNFLRCIQDCVNAGYACIFVKIHIDCLPVMYPFHFLCPFLHDADPIKENIWLVIYLYHDAAADAST